MMKTAVIILNWNGTAMLRKFLPSVMRNTTDAEVIVADNGSTDESLSVLHDEFPEVRTIVLDRNYGFAEGYNRAIAEVDAEYVVLLNSDVETPAGWLAPLVEYMVANADCAACQPKLLAYHDHVSFEYAGASGGYIDRFGYPFCRGRVMGTVERDNGQYDDVADIHWATGACMMVRRDIYNKCGGLDARFFAHNEEIDLCWRMRLSGHRITCVPQSCVFHVGGGTLPQGNPRKTYLNFRNNLTMLYKNLPDRELGSVMRWRLVLDYVAMLQSVLKLNFADVRAIYKARCDFHRWQKDYAPIRQQIQNCAKRKDNLLMPYSILWQYYVRGKKTFMKQILFILVIMGTMLTSCSSDEQSKAQADSSAKKVRVAVTPTLDCLPLYVAQEIGLDREMGMQLVLQSHPSKADCDSALIGGSVDAIFTDYARAESLKSDWLKRNLEFLNLQIKNESKRRRIKAKEIANRTAELRKRAAKDSLYIFPHSNTQLYFFTNSKSRLREAKQLVDKVVGVDRQGADAMLAQHLLDSVKMADEKVFLVQMQNYDIRQRMLLNNTIDAAVLAEPYATQARKLGHRSLFSGYTVKSKNIGCLLSRRHDSLIRDAYNRACDSINKNGIHAYDSVMQKHFTIPQAFIKDIPAHKYKKIRK